MNGSGCPGHFSTTTDRETAAAILGQQKAVMSALRRLATHYFRVGTARNRHMKSICYESSTIPPLAPSCFALNALRGICIKENSEAGCLPKPWRRRRADSNAHADRNDGKSSHTSEYTPWKFITYVALDGLRQKRVTGEHPQDHSLLKGASSARGAERSCRPSPMQPSHRALRAPVGERRALPAAISRRWR